VKQLCQCQHTASGFKRLLQLRWFFPSLALDHTAPYAATQGCSTWIVFRLADKKAMIAAHEATIADLRHRFDIVTQQLGEALS
jgi:hypothetical protein